MGIQVLGTGSYVPDAVITNDHLHERLGFDSDWIVKHTGMFALHHRRQSHVT
jgi:3-oxoacyl-[acyl-carrier-protein] synthase-3